MRRDAGLGPGLRRDHHAAPFRPPMQALLEFLVRHGYAIVFLWVLAGQAGLPLPAIPMLLAAGALCGAGKLDLGAVVALSLVASLLADAVWFQIGRSHGAS